MLNSQTKKTLLKKKNLFIGLVFVFFLLTTFIFSLIHTHLTLKNLKFFKISTAATHAQKAIFFPKIANNLTFSSIPSLNIWEGGLNQVVLSQNLLEEGSLYFSSALQPNLEENTDQKPTPPNQQFSQKLSLFNKNLTFLLGQFEKSWLAQKFAPAQFISQINSLKTLNSELTSLTEHFLTGQRTYIIILQNSQEIRATGGFMGSYARLELDNGSIKKLKIEDIYQPDGQFTGFIEPPGGVDKYLSSDNGLRLPDSNWSPDFPTSAQTILNFFALGGENSIDGLIAINLTIAQNMLDVVGDIYLPDYNVTINSNNLAEMARVDRDQFFPGSKQKPNFLNALLRQFVFRIQELDPEQKRQIFSQLLIEIPQKNIQFYSNQEKVQTFFRKYNLSGEMTATHPTPSSHPNSNPESPTTSYLYLVESNVGINKANKKIFREVFIDLQDKKITITVDFSNQNTDPPSTSYLKPNPPNQAKNLNYVNYQRLFILPSTQVNKITFNDTPIIDWDEELLFTPQRETFKQIGFLITIPEKNTARLTIELTPKELFSLNPILIIQKQSGLPAVPYSIKYYDDQKNILLEKDEVISF